MYRYHDTAQNRSVRVDKKLKLFDTAGKHHGLGNDNNPTKLHPR